MNSHHSIPKDIDKKMFNKPYKKHAHVLFGDDAGNLYEHSIEGNKTTELEQRYWKVYSIDMATDKKSYLVLFSDIGLYQFDIKSHEVIKNFGRPTANFYYTRFFYSCNGKYLITVLNRLSNTGSMFDCNYDINIMSCRTLKLIKSMDCKIKHNFSIKCS